MTSSIIYSNKPRCSCTHCKSEVTTCNLHQHYKSKACLSGGKQSFTKSACCKHCSLSFDGLSTSERANHTRWCDKNPRSVIDREAMRNNTWGDEARRKAQLPENKAKNIEGVKQAHIDGRYKGAAQKGLYTRIKNGRLKHSPQAIENCKRAAMSAKHQRKCKKSHLFTDKRGREFIFDSSWEDALAKRLDELNINWTRPDPIDYTLNGKSHKYFPDFYLPDYGLFLDPKNPWAEKQQKEKLNVVSNVINLEIIRSVEDCKNYQPRGQDSNLHSGGLEDR